MGLYVPILQQRTTISLWEVNERSQQMHCEVIVFLLFIEKEQRPRRKSYVYIPATILGL